MSNSGQGFWVAFPIVSAFSDLPLSDPGPWGRHFLVCTTPDATLPAAKGDQGQPAIMRLVKEPRERIRACHPGELVAR